MREKYQSVASLHAPTEDQTYNLGMCPDQESNPHLFSLQDNAPTNWATQGKGSGLFCKGTSPNAEGSAIMT